jgi:hypothetical protein
MSAATATATATAAPAHAAPLAMVSDLGALAYLESRGWSLAERVAGKAATDNQQLYATAAWRSIASTIERDIETLDRSDGRSGIGMKHAHRLFNPAWLAAATARFELVGVVNRLDRAAFVTAEQCGELRLVYRLAYSTQVKGVAVNSRLPMTVNVVAWQDKSEASCAETAKRWAPAAGLQGEALGRWLASPAGPLASKRGWQTRLKSVEINLQSVRWPSTVHPSMAGHAEYLLRVFHPDGRGAFAPAPMENQVDVPRLRRDAKLRTELLAWLRLPSNLAAIDAGVAVVPERFVAKQARSVAPRGMARLANRPFRQLYRPRDFAQLDLTKMRFARTPEELLRRLDAMSCTGCHHSRSLAGFHLLGEEPAHRSVDALAEGSSPHLRDELRMRREALAKLAGHGGALERPRPLPERVPDDIGGPGGWGDHCGLGAQHFGDWSCQQGLSCQPVLGEPLVGACLRADAVGIGGACEVGTVTQKADPHADRVGAIIKRACTAGTCERNAVGFPGGMCSARCGQAGDDGVCGGIAILVDFNDCLAQHIPFERCIVENSRSAALRRCDEVQRCRDDYICARAGAEGACMPPYFLFQLRVDGHPM